MPITLTVEDGTGVTGANTYAAAATVDTYHTDLGNSAWTGTDDAKAAAILRAMRYLESLAFKGVKEDQDNALEWPRIGAVDRNGYEIDSDVIPQALINALCEASLVEVGSANALRASMERGGQVIREKVDVLETEYAPGAPAGTVYPAVLSELRGLIKGGGAAVGLVRA